MADLRTSICGVEFKNPVIAASGCFGFGREYSLYHDLSALGGIALKAVTLEERKGNRPPRIAETPSGILNSVGLQNPGVDTFLQEEAGWLSSLDTVLFANIAGSTVDEYCAVAEKLKNTPVDFLELNISCPNVWEGGAAFGARPETIFDVTKQVKKHSSQPLFVKLTPNTIDIKENAKAAEEAGADGISLINTLIGMAIDINTRKPILGNVIGGLSGPAIFPVALRMVWQAASAVQIPVIGMGGIASGDDAVAMLMAGASAVMVGTMNLVYPDACPKVIAGINSFLDRKNITCVKDIIGTLEVS